MMFEPKTYYTYDDVLLVPKHSKIKSRSEVDLSVDLGKDVKLNIPVISANMKNVTGFDLALEVAKLGGLALLHRFYPSPCLDQLKIFQSLLEIDKSYVNNVGASIGIQKEDLDSVGTFIS